MPPPIVHKYAQLDECSTPEPHHSSETAPPERRHRTPRGASAHPPAEVERSAPGRSELRLAPDAFLQRNLQPPVDRGRRRHGRRGGGPHELLDGGGHGRRLLRGGAWRDDRQLRAAVHDRPEAIVPPVPAIPVLDQDAVLAAVSPASAIEHVREALIAHHRGEWTMPPKVYLDSPPDGDFRAMPALGGGLALLK